MNNQNFIKKAFWVFVVNSVLGSLSVTLGTMADAIIVGNALGESGLAGINIAMPVYMFYNMLSFAIGIGATTKVSVAIGEDNKTEMAKVFSVSIFWGLAISILFSLVSSLFIEQIVSFLSGGTLLGQYKEYVKMILVSAPVFILTPILNLLLRADSDIKLSTIGIFVSAVVNIVLDIVFVYGLKLNLYGAALAMVFGQLSAFCIYLIHFFKKKNCLKFVPIKIRISEAIELFESGFGVASSYMYQCITIISFNNILGMVAGSVGIAVFGILFNVSCLSYTIFDGISLAIVPLVGMFLGERNPEGIEITMKNALRTALIAGVTITVIILFFSSNIFAVFGVSDLSMVGRRTVMYYGAAVTFICFNSVMICYFQTIGRKKFSTVMNFFRSCVFMLSLGLVFIGNLGIDGLGLTFLFAESISSACILTVAISEKKKGDFDNLLLLQKTDGDSGYEVMLDKDFKLLPKVVEDIEIFCEENEISPDKAYYINLTIEELASNIIQFGFNDNKPHYISIKVVVYEEDVYIRLRDDAVDYNPFERDNKSPNSLDDMDMDFIGVTLIRQKAKSFIYQRKLVFNNLLIIL